jgi:hypothetical protein
MHSVLGWKAWLTAALAICVAIIGARLLVGSEILPSLQSGMSLTSLLVTVFVATPIWRLLWLVPYFQRKAPQLDGEWSGVVASNWSVVERLKEAAKQAGAPALDVDDLARPLPDLVEVPVSVKIRTTFARIYLELESADDRYQISTVKAVELRPANEAGDAVLSYVFEGRVLNPKAGDVGCFDGAATLSLRSQASGGLAMAGPTWTNRAWSRGLNTAGVLRLTRIRADFWTPLTFGLIKR